MKSGKEDIHPSRPPGVCCDVFSKHSKPISKDLRVMSEADKNRFLLQAPDPQYWCSSCRKQAYKQVLPAGNKTTSAETDPNSECHSVLCVGDGFELPSDKTVAVNADIKHEPQRPSGSLQCGFFGTPTSCSGALTETQSLIYDERRALGYLAKLSKIKTEVDAVCDSHYQALIGVFKESKPTFTKSCCNPFKDHFRQISISLRPIRMVILLKAQKKNISLVYGDMICSNCVKRLFDVTVIRDVETPQTHQDNDSPQPIQCTQESGSSTSTTVSPAVVKARAISSLAAFGVSAFKPQKRTHQGLVKYANEKLDEAAELSKKKICLALDLPATSLESSAPQRAIDMDLLLEDIKNELPKADKARTYQLLSLVPLSINTNQASCMFNISKSLFNKARELRVQQGILPQIKFSRNSSVSDATRKLIIDFYCDDDNSKLLPGKDDKVSMSKGVYEQKRLLLCSVEELFSLFKKKYPELKIGLSVFYKLRPKYCVGTGVTGTHKICVCQTHEDVRLLVNALGIKTYYRDLIAHVVCNKESHTCMLRLCDNCFNTAQIECFLREEIMKAVNASCPEEDVEEFEEFWEESLKYLQWTTSNKQAELVTQLSQRSDVVRLAAQKLEQMIPHEFIARKQSDYFKELKSTLPPNKVVVLMDFAMNFSCIYPSEIQSYHFSKKQVTIHPTVIFHRQEGREETDYHNICFISSDFTHDVSMVQVFIRRIVEIIKEKFPQVSEVEYVTDGCASQYKNKISFWNLCHHRTLYQMKAKHSYFASSHGKNMCDALAGLIKRALATGSLHCRQEEIINSAEKAYEFCKTHSLSQKVNFVLVPKEEVEHERTVTVDGNLLNCVPGTRSFHCFEPLSETTIGCKRISEMSTYQLIHCLQKELCDDTPQHFEAGSFIVVKVNSRKYLGLLTDEDTIEQEAEVSLLRPPLPAEVFYWPENLASMVIPLPHVMCRVELSELPDNRYSLTEADRQTLINKKNHQEKETIMKIKVVFNNKLKNSLYLLLLWTLNSTVKETYSK